MITLRQIMQNISKGQSAINVKAILNDLENQYLGMKDKIEIVGCEQRPDTVTIYTKIPSKDKTGIFYDVCLKFDYVEGSKINIDTPLRVYSNSPLFAYNFAYIFHLNKSLLFPEYYPSEFKKMPPKKRNPFGVYAFDRQVFSAIRYIFDYGIKNIIEEFNGRIVRPKSFTQKSSEVKDFKTENS